MTARNCPDCNAAPGETHHPNCDVAQCPACGDQRLFGCCRTRRKPLPWSGEWPGAAECREYGFWCVGPPWRPCSADTPGAREDLTRLAMECDWNPRLGRYIRPKVKP